MRFLILMIAIVLIVIFAPKRNCADTRPWSAGNSTLGASGTYCAAWKK